MSVQEVENAVAQFSLTELQHFTVWFEEYKTVQAIKPREHKSPATFSEIFMPTLAGFQATGLTDDELSEAIEAEVKAYRAERRLSEQNA